MAEGQEARDIHFGSQISLSGFGILDGGSILILKKILGNHVKKISDRSKNFQELKLALKRVHETEGSEMFELRGQVIDKGNLYTAEHTDRNIFITVNKVLRKLEEEMR